MRADIHFGLAMQDSSNTDNYPGTDEDLESIQSITAFETVPEIDSTANSIYVSSNDVESLQSRLMKLEEQEAAGSGGEQAANVLRARLELAKAKASLESKEKNRAGFQPIRSTRKSPMPISSRSVLLAKDSFLGQCLQYSSSICAVIGGILLSSNTNVSKYGFIFLACSSSQIFISSMLLKQKSLMLYGGSLFILVDCVGIYRWIIAGSP